MSHALPWELLGLTEGRFVDEVFDGVPHHHRPTSLPAFDLASPERLLERLAEGAPPERVDLKGFLGFVPRWDYVDGASVDVDRVRQRVLDEGHSLVLRGVHTWLHQAAAFARCWERRCRALVRSNVYLTPASTRAYPLHWDTHGLVAMQLHGRKRWALYAPIHERPLPGQTYDRLPVSYEGRTPDRVVELEAGDVLYVPRGWAHEVLTTDTWSLHITFGFHRLTAVDAVAMAARDAVDRLASDPTLRGYLDPSAPAEALEAAATKALREALRSQLEALAAQQGRAAHPDGELRATSDHWYVEPDRVAHTLDVVHGQPRQAAHQRVTLPAAAAPLVEALFRAGAVDRAEAESLVGPAVLATTVDTLTTHGLLEPR